MSLRTLGFVAVFAGCLVLFGCARDVTMVNPRTGETALCAASPGNPWSQQEACIGDHVARGWARQE